MILTNQQKYIVEVLKQLKYLRVRQLHAMMQAHFGPLGIEIGEQRLNVMPCLLRFGGDGEMLGLLFSVTWLDIPGRIAAAPRMKGERIIWITDCVDMGSINLPKHHFFAHRQQDGTHRFYGSSESERNQDQEVN